MTDSPIDDVTDTALWTAALRAKESERADALFRDPLAARLAGERGRAGARAMPYHKMFAWLLAVRTVLIDRLVDAALAAGVDTVVNIGAGLDTRPYRLILPPPLTWIEIDFPQTIAAKNAALAAEKPKCNLRRIGLDLADRAAAQTVYAELGAATKSALIITEGVIGYLDNEVAGHLADDLHAVPSFRFWIQDYRRTLRNIRNPRRLKAKLAHAPFKFAHADPLAFFAAHGWRVEQDLNGLAEGAKLGRPAPIPFLWNLLIHLMRVARRNDARNSLGFALLASSAK